MMSAGAAWIVRDILESGGHPDRPFYESGNQGRRLAWKTGTSFGFRDAWSVGVTDRWTIGVWVGRPDGTPIRAFRRQCGGAVAAGHRRGLAGRRAATPDPARHGASRRDVLAAGLPVGQRPDRRLPRAARGLGPERHGAAVLRRLRRRHQGPLRLGGVSAGAVLRPVPGSRQVALDVDAQGAEGEVWWMLDGRVVNHGAAAHPFKLVLAQDGRYTLTVMDTKGRHDSVVLKSLVLRHDRHRI